MYVNLIASVDICVYQWHVCVVYVLVFMGLKMLCACVVKGSHTREHHFSQINIPHRSSDRIRPLKYFEDAQCSETY